MRIIAATFLASAFVLAPWAIAQPTSFVDLDTIVVPVAPPTANDSVDTSTSFAFSGETLTVQWFRFTLADTVENDLYLDVSADIFEPERDLALALYDAAGNLVATDDTVNGVFANGSSLSFGSNAERTPPDFRNGLGTSGSVLPAGEYWLAVVAGTGSAISFGPTNWNAQTTTSFPLGFGEGQSYIEVYVTFGNTTPPPPPINDACEGAIAISEDVGATPAFVGTNAGATQDGSSPCYANLAGVTFKDVWFTYTPTQSGWVQIVATGTDGSSPILSRWSGCGGFVEQCSGSGNFALVGGTRIGFEAVQGVPVLLSLAMRAGGTGTFRLNIDRLGAPCTLNAPGPITLEGEACLDASNDGCNVPGGAFGTILPGQTIGGTLWNSTNASVRDRDWYLLDVPSAVIATLSLRAQVSAEAVILGPPEFPDACSGRQLLLVRSADFLNACQPASASVVLTPGQYFVAAAHLFGDGFFCDSGYNGYRLALTTQPCDQPQVVSSPVDVQGALGGSATFTGALSSSVAVEYTWQWGQALAGIDPPLIVWNDLLDGDFSDLFSSAQISGSETSTLTISGIDQTLVDLEAPLYFRLKGQTCAPNFTLPAELAFQSPCPACAADYDGNGGTDGGDLAAFIRDFESGQACADVDQDGGVGGSDLGFFFAAFEAGGC